MRDFRPAIWSYVFLFIANVTDILSSLGKLEQNPLTQRDVFFPMFDPVKALKVKGIFFLFYLVLGAWVYIMVSPVSRKAAAYAAALIPVHTTYLLFYVTIGNML